MASQTILEEEFDENYEPTEEEVVDYAKFLGMDAEKDKHLFWIARESLKAPLPANWKPCQTDDGNIYYFNFGTGESIWDHPCDDHYRKLYEREKAKGPPGAGLIAETKSLAAGEKIHESNPAAPKIGAKMGALPSIPKKSESGAPSLGGSGKKHNPAIRLGFETDEESDEGEDVDWDEFDDDDDSNKDILDRVLHRKGIVTPNVKADRSAGEIKAAIKIPKATGRTDKDDDFDFDLSSEEAAPAAARKDSKKKLPGAEDMTFLRFGVDRDTPATSAGLHSSNAEREEKQRYEKASEETRARWKSEIERVEKDEKKRAADEIERIRAKYRDDINSLESSLKVASERTIEDIRDKWSSKILSAEKEEQRKFEKEAAAIESRFQQKLRDLEGSKCEYYEHEEEQAREARQAESSGQKKLEQDLEEIRRKNAKALQDARREETAKLDAEIAQMRKDLEKRKQSVEKDLSKEIQALEEEYNDRKETLHKEFQSKERKTRAELEASVKDKHQAELDDLTRTLAKEFEEKERQKRESYERESASRLEKLKAELRQRDETSIEEERIVRKREFDRAKQEWDAKIRDLEAEMSRKEEGLRVRMKTLDKVKDIDSAADLAALKAENDMLYEQQRKRKKELDREREQLNEMEDALASRRVRLEQDQDHHQFERPHTPSHLTRERDAISALENDLLERRHRIENERSSLRIAQTEVDSLRLRIESEKEALLRMEKDLVIERGRQSRADIYAADNVVTGYRGVSRDRGISRDRGVSRERPQSRRLEDISIIQEEYQRKLQDLATSLEPITTSRIYEEALDEHGYEDSEMSEIFPRRGHPVDEEDILTDLSAIYEVSRNDRDPHTRSPSAQLRKRLAHEEQHIQKAKKFLHKQRKDINTRQNELEEARSKWRRDINEIRMNIDQRREEAAAISDAEEEAIRQEAKNASKEQRVGALNEIEGELGKLLGVLRSTTNYVVSSNSESVAPKRHSSPSYTYHAPRRTADAIISPTVELSSSIRRNHPTSAAVSLHRKRAWEVGHTRTEALLAEHNAWLKGFMARHAGVLTR